MRILITSIGDSEIKTKLSPDKSQSTDNIFTQNKLKLFKSLKKSNISISTERKKPKNPNTSLNIPSIYSIKSIEIKSPKQLIISQISKMYERPLPVQTPSSSIINDQFSMPLVLSPHQKHQKQLPLLDIVPDAAVDSLLKFLSKKKGQESKHKVINSETFRSTYEPKGLSESAKIKDLLKSTNVSLNHSYLVNYLSKSENCNPTVFAKVNKAKESELSKLNKVCQTVLVNRAQDVLFKDNVTKVFENKLLTAKESVKTRLDKLQQNMEISNQIIQRYSKLSSKLNAYIDNHYQIQQKYWSKFDFDKWNFKRKQKNNRPLSPTQREFSQGNIFKDTIRNHHFTDKNDD